MNEVVFLIIILSAYILPVVIVVNSKRTQGHEKNGWLLGVIIFSWLGLLCILRLCPSMVTKKKKNKPS
ncbi:hypothetical protein P4S68_13330 [Pseudoalteromonas sp. Hal099]